MKRVVTLLLSATLLFASGKYLSPLPLPTLHFISLDPYPCDASCLQEHWQNEEYFSFLANLTPQTQEEFRDQYAMLASKLPLPRLFTAPTIKIVLIARNYLRPVVTRSTKALLAYLMEKEADFSLTTRYLDSSTPYEEAIEPGAVNVVFATFNDKEALASLDGTATTVFVPTLNKIFVQNPALWYGGIDYLAQLKALHTYYDGPTALFYLQDSALSQTLTDYYQELAPGTKLFALKHSDKNAARYLRKNYALNRVATLFNTPPIKTAMIVSQMAYYQLAPKYKLSTQINFSHKLFALLQPKTRAGFIFANAIVHIPPTLAADAALIDEDIAFDWLGYALFVGIDNILAARGDDKCATENFVDHQIEYDNVLFASDAYGLHPVDYTSFRKSSMK